MELQKHRSSCFLVETSFGYRCFQDGYERSRLPLTGPWEGGLPTANLRAKILDFGRLDSSRILSSRGRSSHVRRKFPRNLEPASPSRDNLIREIRRRRRSDLHMRWSRTAFSAPPTAAQSSAGGQPASARLVAVRASYSIGEQPSLSAHLEHRQPLQQPPHVRRRARRVERRPSSDVNIIGIFRGPLFRGPLIISLYVLI